ncbi:MAG: phytoene/squalene synthase family protein [Spirochaetes bacterium]|nr:phytoene/squalene synthase family protein [Spirochaetota bacterium]
MQNIIYNTFKKGSTTYFNSSIFFPKTVKDDVFVLYGFVRKADNFVDSIPQQAKEFYLFKDSYYKALKGGITNDVIIDSFAGLMKRKFFDTAWVDAFLSSMELDLKKSKYKSMNELLEYIYGSAEVIGLMMSSIMGLEPKSHIYARRLGRAMQFINFIRDINEDIKLGRTYLPIAETKLKSLDKDYALKNKDIFIEFIRSQIRLYMEWQAEAEKGFAFIPHRFLIPIKTASDMYKWTAGEIYNDPFIVYEKTVKPVKSRIIFTILKNFLNKI